MEEQGGGFLSKPRNLIIVAIVGVLAIGVFLARRSGGTSGTSTSGGTQYIPTTGDTYVNYSYTSTVPPSASGAPAVPPASSTGYSPAAQSYYNSVVAANPGASSTQVQQIIGQQQAYVAQLEQANPGATAAQLQQIMAQQQAYRASQGA